MGIRLPFEAETYKAYCRLWKEKWKSSDTVASYCYGIRDAATIALAEGLPEGCVTQCNGYGLYFRSPIHGVSLKEIVKYTNKHCREFRERLYLGLGKVTSFGDKYLPEERVANALFVELDGLAGYERVPCASWTFHYNIHPAERIVFPPFAWDGEPPSHILAFREQIGGELSGFGPLPMASASNSPIVVEPGANTFLHWNSIPTLACNATCIVKEISAHDADYFRGLRVMDAVF